MYSFPLLLLIPGENLGCFGASKKKKEAQQVQQVASTSRRNEPIKGMELLWQPEVSAKKCFSHFLIHSVHLHFIVTLASQKLETQWTDKSMYTSVLFLFVTASS